MKNHAQTLRAVIRYGEKVTVLDAAQLLIYTKRGHPIRKIRELFERDATINTRDAQKLNLIDAVIASGSFSEMQLAVGG